MPMIPTGAHPQIGKASYSIGIDESKHRDGLPSYERMNLGDVYPGINVQLRATGANVEKIFTVAPRYDPTMIQVRLDGAQQLELGPHGELIAHTGNGPVTYTPPIAFQENATGQHVAVQVRYTLASTSYRYSFAVGAYDADRPLVIDPLLQSTYLGGATGDDIPVALAFHPVTGDVYVAGYTYSTDFPKVAGAEQAVKGANFDAFVTRLNAALTTRLQSTYVGGNGDDFVSGLAIHPATGEVYVAGSTLSTDFPKVVGADQATHAADAGAGDAFVTRLNAALTIRLQSTYLGGTGDDGANTLAIHPSTGEVYVSSTTTSSNFPKVAGAEQAAAAGAIDAFVSRYTPALTFSDNTPAAYTFVPQTNVPLLSVRTSNPIQITGINGAANIYVLGQPGSSHCISFTNACCNSANFVTTPSTVSNNQFVCVRHTASPILNQVTETMLHVGGSAASFFVTTGTLLGGNCTLNVDGNGIQDALTDGLMVLRALFGLTGTSVTNGAVGANASRNTWALVRQYLNGNCGASFAP